MPSQLSASGATQNLCSSFQFVQTGQKEPILSRAFDRYQGYIFGSNSSGDPTPSACLSALTVTLQSRNVTLGLDTDESYSLDTNAGTLNANNVFGAIRGLETFYQLISQSGSTLFVSLATISDSPRFQWRGLLIDTARHYLSVSTLLKVVDAMAFSKLNVLHWHMVDAESFPLVVSKYPNLSAAGAYHPTSVYGASDIAQVVAFALDRGIRVIPEVDMPGHAYSWGKGYPWSVATCPNYAHNINNIPLNPAEPNIYNLVSGVLDALAQSFQDSYVHLGGDEVIYGCWLEDPSVQAYMRKNGIPTANALMEHFLYQVQPLASARKRTPVYWEEVFLSGASIPSQSIIQVWKDEPTLIKVAQSGTYALLSYGWYLVDTTQYSWQTFYNNEPFASGSWTPAEEKMVKGGEVCAWGEYVDDYNIASVLWPRTAAAAERLWSPSSWNDVNEAKTRLVEHICRLNKRGVASGPIGPGTCY